LITGEDGPTSGRETLSFRRGAFRVPKNAGFTARMEVVMIWVFEQLAEVAAAAKRLVVSARSRGEVEQRLRRYASPTDPLMIRLRRYAG